MSKWRAVLQGRWTFVAGAVAGAIVVGAVMPALIKGTPVERVTAGDAGAGTSPTGLAREGGRTGSLADAGTEGAVSGAAGRDASGTAGAGDSGAGVEGPGDGPGATGAGAGRPTLTASDRGVTSTAIRVGALVLDVATVGRLGVAVAIDPEQQCLAYQSYFDEINSRGGIHGRRIEGHCEPYDVTSTDDQIRACRALTQDKKVFAVLGGFNTVVPNLCIVDENRTPLISNHHNFPDWVFERSHGLLVTLYQRSGRHMDAVTAEMARLGLAEKRIGILTDGLNDPRGHVMSQLEERLGARGAQVVYKGQLASDIPTASSQIPVEVQKARTARAEVMVFLASNAVYGTMFVSHAEEQAFHPIYLNSDWAANNGDGTNQNMPRSYEGAIGITTSQNLTSEMQPAQEPSEASRCRKIYDQHSGRRLTPPRDGQANNEYGLTVASCDVVRVFESLAATAGPELTRGSLMGSLSALGHFQAANWGGGSLAPQKHDYADLVRTQRWNFDCKCWHRWEDFHRPGG